MKLLMILICKGICAPIAPLSKVRGGSAPVMHPRSGVPGYRPAQEFVTERSSCAHRFGNSN